jgi:hypothetical protein
LTFSYAKSTGTALRNDAAARDFGVDDASVIEPTTISTITTVTALTTSNHVTSSPKRRLPMNS